MLERFTREEIELIKKELAAMDSQKVAKKTVTAAAFKRLEDEIGWKHAYLTFERALIEIADLTLGEYIIRHRHARFNGKDISHEDVRRNGKLTKLVTPKYENLINDMVTVIVNYFEDLREERTEY